jgi:hypothetical protein
VRVLQTWNKARPSENKIEAFQVRPEGCPAIRGTFQVGSFRSVPSRMKFVPMSSSYGFSARCLISFKSRCSSRCPTCAGPSRIVSCSRSILDPTKPENLTDMVSASLSTERHSEIGLHRILARSRDSWQTERAAGYVPILGAWICRDFLYESLTGVG